MEYKDLGDIKRQLPRISFSKKAKNGDEAVGWNQEIQNIKDEFDNFQNQKKDDKDLWSKEFDRSKLNQLIDYYQSVLKTSQ